MSEAKRAFEQGEGILRLTPTWVPRSFCIPGRRIKLHPRDYYAFGAVRGGIDERWFSSTTHADNGPLTTKDEGLSYVAYDGEGQDVAKIVFADVVADLGAELLGDALWDVYGGWPMYSKFFDNKGALPHHMHQMQEHAEAVGQKPKPEAYYFSPQMNNYGADYPYTFFGLEPGTTKAEVRACLERWEEGDNGIRYLSKAYRLELGTGWYVPAGLLHAPGSLCTYEPQWASDVFSMFQSLVNDVPTPWENLVKDVPDDKKQDLDYIVSMVDWDANVTPDIKKAYFRPPLHVRAAGGDGSGGLRREVDYLWQRLHCRQGTDGIARRHGDHQGCRPLRLHHRPGSWHNQQLGHRNAGVDSFWSADKR